MFKPFTILIALFSSLVMSSDALSGIENNPSFFTNTLAANDDGSTGSVPIGFSSSINFFGTNYSNLFVNNNGNVTFNSALSTFTPFGLLSSSTPIIAPFFGDVDTNGIGSGLVHYGQGTYAGRDAFAATWGDINAGPGVGYYQAAVDKTNKFQLILVERFDVAPGDFDIIFKYDQIEWETGDASGGSGGLGGDSARVGYSNGSTTALELAGSGVNGAFLDGGPNSLVDGSNIGTPMMFMFQARDGGVVQPPNGVIPEPVSALVWGGLVVVGSLATRRRRSLVS